MTTLFHPLQIGDLTIRNRIIMAPMTRGRANDAGEQAHYAADYYAQRASAGLLITEAVYISPLARPNDNTPGIFTEAQVESWKPVTDAVHNEGGSIFMQLIHAGRVTLPGCLPENSLPVSASAIRANSQNFSKQGQQDCVTPRALTVKEIEDVIYDFVVAARNALKAGFDGVELHGAYGYLIHQFLGTNSNRRTDAYGGNDVNRARFLLELVDAVAEVTGAERLGVRLSPGNTQFDIEEANVAEFYPYLLKELDTRRLAYLHMVRSADETLNDLLRRSYKGVYLLNGGFTYESGMAMVAKGGADAIVYGKPFIANPDLVERFRAGVALDQPDFAHIYSAGEKGYTDYKPFRVTAE